MNIFGQELQVLDVSSAEHGGAAPGPARVARPTGSTSRTVSELKRILSAHPGESPVHLRCAARRRPSSTNWASWSNADHVASDIKGSFRPGRVAGRGVSDQAGRGNETPAH